MISVPAACLLVILTGPSTAEPTAAPGAESAAVQLGLDEAVARALGVSPRIARSSAQAAMAQAESRGARAERWPELDLTAGYQRRSDVPELSIPVASGDPAKPPTFVTVFPNIPDNSRLRAAATLPLFTSGRISGAVAASEHALTAATQDLRTVRADLVLEVKVAYWGLVTSREGVRVLSETIRALDAHLQDARNRERFGMAARNEVLAVQVERDRAELDRLRAETNSELAEANLRRLLELAPATRIAATEPLAMAPPAMRDIEALVVEASAQRPERAALAARVSATDATIRSKRGARLPQLGLAGGYTYANPNRDIVPPSAEWNDTWDVGVSLSWSVLDGGRRSAGEARARAQADAVRAQLAELDGFIRLETTSKALELRTAVARAEVAERALVAAQENRKVAADRYREGVIPSSELLDAEVALERSSLSLTEAKAALRLAAAGLDRAIGR